MNANINTTPTSIRQHIVIFGKELEFATGIRAMAELRDAPDDDEVVAGLVDRLDGAVDPHRAVAQQRVAQRGPRPLAVGELVGAALRRPLRVVEILLAPTRIAAGCLQMAIGARRNPDIAPRRRYRQLPDAREFGGVAQEVAVRKPV